jgi:monoterpene epsilon-lactone hydrolase
MSTKQRENLDAILRQSAFPAGSDVNEQRRLLRELLSAQPLPADVTVTAAALDGVPTAEITVDGIEPRHVVVYFHGGVYVMGDASLAADLASQVGRRTQAKVISVGYRLAPEHPYPAAVDDALAAYGVPHVFQAYYPILEEAAAALDRAGQFVSAHLAGAALRAAA